MKRILAVTAIAAALSITPVLAQQGTMGGQGMGGMMGPGMMGGQGMGGMMGPGMMGGQGMGGMMGPGMMGGQGMGGMMGPGMMGGQGMGGMMGPGMMGGQGMGGMMGPGMMGGHGMGGMMGPGMMGGHGMGGLGYLNLSDDQRQKIGEIQQEVSRKHWDLMAKMHEQQYRMHELQSGKTDDAEARKAYAAMSDSHRQMFETMLDARKRIDAVLTREQREKRHGGMRGGMGKH